MSLHSTITVEPLQQKVDISANNEGLKVSVNTSDEKFIVDQLNRYQLIS